MNRIETSVQAPHRWQYHVHPDGGLYFIGHAWVPFFYLIVVLWNDRLTFRPQNIPILTDVYLYDADSRVRLENIIENVLQYIEKYDITFSSQDICLVLEFRQSGRYGYYFVDHRTRCLFWLEKYDAMEFLAQVRVKYTPSLIGEFNSKALLLLVIWLWLFKETKWNLCIGQLEKYHDIFSNDTDVRHWPF